jgi:hypothetical protein
MCISVATTWKTRIKQPQQKLVVVAAAAAEFK